MGMRSSDIGDKLLAWGRLPTLPKHEAGRNLPPIRMQNRSRDGKKPAIAADVCRFSKEIDSTILRGDGSLVKRRSAQLAQAGVMGQAPATALFANTSLAKVKLHSRHSEDRSLTLR